MDVWEQLMPGLSMQLGYFEPGTQLMNVRLQDTLRFNNTINARKKIHGHAHFSPQSDQ